MTKKLASDLLSALAGKTLATAESCTGGGIGQVLTSVPGSSKVYVGGIISYTNAVKHKLLRVSDSLLAEFGAVSKEVAAAMAQGAAEALEAYAAISITGLAGPDGDDRGNSVGTVFIGYTDPHASIVREYHFSGSREEIRKQAVDAALYLALSMQ